MDTISGVDRPRPPRVVAAVDHSIHAPAVVQRAAIEAAAHGASLEVLRAWSYLDQDEGGFDPHHGEAKVREDVAATVAEALGATRPACTTVHVVNDLPARAIIEASQGAFLVVMGARGLGTLKSIVLGSVSQEVLGHAACPVLIVR